jgi:hypothetical protein
MAEVIVAGLLRRLAFDSRSVNVRFMVEKVALGQVFLRELSVVHPSVSFHNATGSTNGISRVTAGNLPKIMLYRTLESIQ